MEQLARDPRDRKPCGQKLLEYPSFGAGKDVVDVDGADTVQLFGCCVAYDQLIVAGRRLRLEVAKETAVDLNSIDRIRWMMPHTVDLPATLEQQNTFRES